MRLLGRQTKASGQKLNCPEQASRRLPSPPRNDSPGISPPQASAPAANTAGLDWSTVGCRAKGRASLGAMEKEGTKTGLVRAGQRGDKSFCGRSTRLVQKGGLRLEQKRNSKPQPHMLLKRNCGVGTKLINIASCLNNPTKKPEFSAQERWPVPGQHV